MTLNISYLLLNSTTEITNIPGYVAIQIFMWIAVVLTIVLLLPAVIDIAKTNNTVSISKWMYILYPFCDLMWIIYAILLIIDPSVRIEEIIGIGICEFLNLIFTTYILVKKLKNVREAKNMHMSEAEWYRWTLKEKAEKEKLKQMGIKNRHDLHELKNQRYKLIKILKDLFEGHRDLVDSRITKSKEYIKSVKDKIKSPRKRLEHFINIATNADIARIIWLIYLDTYKIK